MSEITAFLINKIKANKIINLRQILKVAANKRNHQQSILIKKILAEFNHPKRNLGGY